MNITFQNQDHLVTNLMCITSHLHHCCRRLFYSVWLDETAGCFSKKKYKQIHQKEKKNSSNTSIPCPHENHKLPYSRKLARFPKYFSSLHLFIILRSIDCTMLPPQALPEVHETNKKKRFSETSK